MGICVDGCLCAVRTSPHNSVQPIFTVRKRSCGNVMFSQACVKNSGHRREMYIPRQTPPHKQTTSGQTPWADTLLGRHPLGRHSPGRLPPPSDGHCSGQYASYWNAFLFFLSVVDSVGFCICRLYLRRMSTVGSGS